MQTKRIFQLWVLIVIILALLPGCTAAQSGKAASNEVKIADDANGQKITLKQDQAFTVRLQSNITTGFSWEISACDQAVLAPQGEPVYEESDSSQQRTGAGGWQVFHFKPAKSGQTSLKLIYRRPWEKDVKPVQTFEVQVTVE